jgi:aminoglycoside phosphotransferase (APT) family kinase protein
VPGVELWQIGALAVWEEVGSWLGRFHAGFVDRVEELRRANPYLLEHSAEWFGSWRDRTRADLADSRDPRAKELRRALERYDQVIESLCSQPRTFVHGELYPSNVLVMEAPDGADVYPVDWEMAAIGPGLIDLAALVGGWRPPERRRLVSAYLKGLGEGGGFAPTPDAVSADLVPCRLHLALQWLGWSTAWRPPPEHAHDWLGEALTLAEELQL